MSHTIFSATGSQSMRRGAFAPKNRSDAGIGVNRSEEHTSELQSRENLVCRLLLEKKKKEKEQYVTLNMKVANKNDKSVIKLYAPGMNDKIIIVCYCTLPELQMRIIAANTCIIAII